MAKRPLLERTATARTRRFSPYAITPKRQSAFLPKLHIPPMRLACILGVTKRDISNRFTNVLYDLTRRGLTEKTEQDPGARWTIAPSGTELLLIG